MQAYPKIDISTQIPYTKNDQYIQLICQYYISLEKKKNNKDHIRVQIKCLKPTIDEAKKKN